MASVSSGGMVAAVKLLKCYRVSGLDQLCLYVPLYLIQGNVGWGLVYFGEKPEDLRIKKAINNNILCAVDEKGREMIVTGRGLGFKRKVGERIDSGLVEKIYHMEGKAEQRRLRELCEQIPMEHLRLTQDLIEYIRGQLARIINLRNTPQLQFIMDQSIAYGVNMSKRIEEVVASDRAAVKTSKGKENEEDQQ